MLGVDLSNYTSDLIPEALQAWKDVGVGLTIVQAVNPVSPFPPSKTRLQIQQCSDAGLAVDAYIWLWFDLDVSDIARKLALLEGLPQVRRVWLDVEDTAAKKYDATVCMDKVKAALAVCDALQTTSGEPAGIYSGRWFWADSAFMDNLDWFKDRDLWDSNYDNIADTTVNFRPYGGWDHCVIKQHVGTTTFHGISGVDLDVLSEAEAAKLTQPPAQDCQLYKDAIERGVNRLQIELDRKTSTGSHAALRRTLVQEIQRELFQALQA